MGKPDEGSEESSLWKYGNYSVEPEVVLRWPHEPMVRKAGRLAFPLYPCKQRALAINSENVAVSYVIEHNTVRRFLAAGS